MLGCCVGDDGVMPHPRLTLGWGGASLYPTLRIGPTTAPTSLRAPEPSNLLHPTAASTVD